MTPKVSIIIVTRNRAADLKPTLESLRRMTIAGELPSEILVVDNGSTDATAEVIRSFQAGDPAVRYLLEPRAGKSNGLNSAMAQAAGDVFLFTDDDVRVPRDWVNGMCRPILADEADAVQGGIRLAPHLLRSWMDHCHHAHLASTAYWHPEKGDRVVLIGCNMAIARKVFHAVPAFDPEIGPGPSAGGEDTLFSFQAELAGFRLAARPQVVVEHHPDESRLGRAQMLRREWRGGVSSAYITHHWEHQVIHWPRLRFLRESVKLMLLRLGRLRQWRHPEGAPTWELLACHRISTLYHYLGERKRARNYPRHGLALLGNGK